MQQNVFVSGGTGYIGSELIRRLVEEDHKVTAVARQGSERKLPAGCAVVTGDALVSASFADAIAAGDTFVHLIGTPHPAPWKAAQFRSIDLVALKASVEAAVRAGAKHFVFVSVAHPAPAMHAYIEVRKECERILGLSGITSTILRPWYVLGPGHRWPVVLLPFYRWAENSTRYRAAARRLGLVTREQMVGALAWAVQNPPQTSRILEVPEIRQRATGQWIGRRQDAASRVPATAPQSKQAAV